MPEIGTSGSMSGDGKRSGAKWPKLPRPSSTLPSHLVREFSTPTWTATISAGRQGRGMNGRTPSAKEATAADEDDGDDDAQRLTDSLSRRCRTRRRTTESFL